MAEYKPYLTIKRWARANWPGRRPARLDLEPIPVDGSSRIFVRLHADSGTMVVLYAPDNQAENRAWLGIGEHLAGLGVPVARQIAADEDAGLFLMEDLGNSSLERAVNALGYDPGAQAMLLEPVLAVLARIQAKGAEGFDQSLCFDSLDLDPGFLRQREAGYFLEQFVKGACGVDEEPPGLSAELDEASRRAGEAGPRGLVHRDFQSRNILVRRGGMGLVDYQGARLGPAQYDAASIIHDPYLNLNWDLRARLLDVYLTLREAEGPFDREAFTEGWPWVSLSRIMQALGAYGFLTRVRGRGHFARYMAPALETLRRLLDEPALAELGELRRLAADLTPPEEAPVP